MRRSLQKQRSVMRDCLCCRCAALRRWQLHQHDGHGPVHAVPMHTHSGNQSRRGEWHSAAQPAAAQRSAARMTAPLRPRHSLTSCSFVLLSCSVWHAACRSCSHCGWRDDCSPQTHSDSTARSQWPQQPHSAACVTAASRRAMWLRVECAHADSRHPDLHVCVSPLARAAT